MCFSREIAVWDGDYLLMDADRGHKLALPAKVMECTGCHFMFLL